MQTEPLISVVVPVFNTKEYLQRCVESILCQSLENIEIILIDDGSTDGSAELIDEYKSKDKRIIAVHKPNGGVSAARNAGISLAKGKLIGFCDSDDYINKDFCASLYEIIKNTGSDISVCSFKFIYDDIKNSAVLQPKIEKEYKVFSYSSEEAVKKLLINQITPGLWNKLYSRNLFESGLRCNENIGMYEDLLLNYELFNKAHKISVIDKPMYNYVVRQASATHTCSKQLSDTKFLALKEIEEDVKKAHKNFLPYMQALNLVLYSGSLRSAEGKEFMLIVQKLKENLTLRSFCCLKWFQKIKVGLSILLPHLTGRLLCRLDKLRQ